MILRPYQIETINKIRQSLKNGNKNVCVALCGGAGKSLIAKEILELSSLNNKKIGFFSYRTLLIDQIKSYKIKGDITFGTLQKHGKNETDLYDLVIIDESWGESSKLRNNIKAKYTITLSGTPTDGYGYALDYDDIIDGVQTVDLINLGYAKPLKILSTSKVDTSKLKTVCGDFSQKEAYELMSKSVILKDLVNVYRTHCKDRKTMIFAVNTKHCEDIKKQFLEAGISCDTVHSKKSDTLNTLDKFDNREIEVIISVSMLNVGYDNPSVNCILFARPTKSIPVMMQTIWRGTRINPINKNDYCLVLDCSEVIKSTGQHPLQRLDFTRKKEDKSKKCQCGLSFKIINRISETIDKYTYQTTTFYKCECGIEDKEEKLHAINFSFCESCGMTIDEKVMQLEHKKGSIEFNYECNKCGHIHSFRQILLSDKQLQEMHEAEVINTYSWEAVNLILKAEAKACGYKWQWVARAMDILQSKDKTPKEVIERIKDLKSRGKKIGSIVYV